MGGSSGACEEGAEGARGDGKAHRRGRGGRDGLALEAEALEREQQALERAQQEAAAAEAAAHEQLLREAMAAEAAQAGLGNNASALNVSPGAGESSLVPATPFLPPIAAVPAVTTAPAAPGKPIVHMRDTVSRMMLDSLLMARPAELQSPPPEDPVDDGRDPNENYLPKIPRMAGVVRAFKLPQIAAAARRAQPQENLEGERAYPKAFPEDEDVLDQARQHSADGALHWWFATFSRLWRRRDRSILSAGCTCTADYLHARQLAPAPEIIMRYHLPLNDMTLTMKGLPTWFADLLSNDNFQSHTKPSINF